MSSDDEWDKSDTEPVALSAAKVAASKWADEDVSDGEVKAQKEAEKNETAIERKVRLANSVMESDLENARALVGDLEISRPKPEVEGVLHLGNMVPGSRTELLEYADLFKKKLDTFNSHASYSVFAEQAVRDLVAPLTVDETRKISSSLTAILNEKQKALKEAQGKGKKKSTNTKKGVVVARGAINEMGDLGNDAYDEFDDFIMHRNHEEANESIATLRAKALVTLRNKLRKPSTPDTGQTLSDAPSPLANEAYGISTLPSARLPGAVASKASSPRSSKRKLSSGADEPSLAHVQGTEIPLASAVVNGTRPEEAMVSDAVSGKSSNPALADLSHPYYVPLQLLAQSGIFAHLLHTLSLPSSEQFSYLLLNQDVLHLVREQLCLLISQGISWTQIEHMGLARICIAHFAPEILGSGDGLAPMAIDTTGPKVRVVQDLPALAAKHKKRKKSKKGAADQTEVPALQSPTVDLEERSDGQLDGSAATVELSDSLQTMPSDLSLAPARDPFALVIDCSDSSSDDGSVELRINAAAPQDIELDIKLQHHAALESELAHASTSLYLDQSLSHSLGIRIKQDEEKKLALEREAVFLEQRSLVAMERAVKLDGIKKECQGHILKLANQIAELEKQRLELEKSRGMFVEKLKGFEADLEQAIKGRESDTAKLAEIKRKQDMLDSGLAKSRAELSEFEQAFIAKKTFVEEKSVILDSMARSGIFTPVSILHRMHDSSFAVSTTVHLEFFGEYTPGFQQVVSDIVGFAELFPASSPRPWCVWKPRIVSYERARLRNASLCAMDLERAGSCTTLNCQFSHGKQLDASGTGRQPNPR
ncbi:hypothetical protein HDU91_003639 [Kappamyces sp. JEL0680]|nr:hypothetical protein HDU91_003639 [Kappamyces sp. JEL0680]